MTAWSHTVQVLHCATVHAAKYGFMFGLSGWQGPRYCNEHDVVFCAWCNPFHGPTHAIEAWNARLRGGLLDTIGFRFAGAMAQATAIGQVGRCPYTWRRSHPLPGRTVRCTRVDGHGRGSADPLAAEHWGPCLEVGCEEVPEWPARVCARHRTGC